MKLVLLSLGTPPLTPLIGETSILTMAASAEVASPQLPTAVARYVPSLDGLVFEKTRLVGESVMGVFLGKKGVKGY
jgi:hypothetical protein